MARFLQRRFSIYFCICAFICTAAFAIQPTVRAGSINLSNNVKPVTPTIAQTGSGDTDTSINRGAALFKFQKTTVPAATPQNTNPTNSGGGGSGSSASNNTLAELQKQIEDLRSAQLTLEQTQTDLEHNAITPDAIANAVAEQVRTLDLTKTNPDLKNALTDIQSTNTDLQTTLNAIQQQADSLNTNIDSRLKYRGLLDSSNNVAFVTKNDITPESLATKIAANPIATATLSEKITPKSSDIQKIIQDDLIEREILDNTGNLNVEKKGEVQITEETVTDALSNSNTFKNLVSAAATEKGFLTKESNTIKNLATKDTVTPEAIAAKIASSTTAQQTLSGKLGPNEDAVRNLIVHDLKTRGIVSNDNNETLQLLKASDLDTKLNEKNVITTANMNTKLTGFAKTTDITPEIIATQIANSNAAQQTLSGKLGPNEDAVRNLIVHDLKTRGIVSNDNNETLQLLKTSDLDTKLNEKNVITTANMNTKLTGFAKTNDLNILANKAITTDNKETTLAEYAKSTDITPETLANQIAENTTATALLSAKIRPNETEIQNIIKEDLIEREILDNTGNLNVEKKGEVQITEETVTDALSNSNTFKNMVSAAAIEKGFVTDSALNNKNFLTTSGLATELNRANVVTTDSDDFKNLATKSSVASLSNSIDVLNADETNANSIAYKIKSLSDKLNAGENTEGSIANRVKTAGFAKTNDVVTKTGFAEQLQNDLNAENSGVKSALATAGFAKTADVVTNTDFKSKLKTNLADSEVKSTLETAGFAKSDAVSALATRTTTLETTAAKAITTDNVAKSISDNLPTNVITTANLDDSNIKTALTDAGFAQSAEITTMRDNLLNGDENTNGSIAHKLKTAKVITETNFADKLPESVITTDNMANKLSGDFATKSSVTSLTNAVNALNDDETNTNSVAYKIKSLSDKLNAGENTEGSIANKLKAANLVSADTMNTTLANFASKDSVSTLSNTLDTLNGNVDNPNSILYKIKNNQTIREALKGDAGTGINYRGEIANYNELESKTKQQGDAYYNNADGLLYICSGDGTTCSWPENTKGVRFKGEKGADAKSVEQAYCDENLNLIKLIYGSNKDCNNFTYANYNEMTGGTRAYCLSLAQKASTTTLKTDSGIGAKLEKIFGTGIVANLIQNKVNTTVDNKNFVLMCEDKYDEIMSGEDGKDGQDGSDGKDAKSAEQTYCETNFATVSALYSGIATESDCANFTAEQYKAMMEGSKAYCLLVAQDFSSGKLNVDSGIGKRLEEELKVDGGNGAGIFSLQPKSGNTVSLSTVLKNTTFNGNKSFLVACAEKYNEIMSGEDGKDGEKGADGEDAVKTWCRAHTLDGAKSGGTVAKTLSAAKLVAAFKASGNTDTQIEKSQDNTTGEVTGYFKTLEACIAAVNEDPTIMSGESAAETQYNEDVKKEKKEGNTNFTLGSNTVTTFETKKNTFGSKMVTADNIGAKLIENKVVTDDNFKNKLKTDLETNDVKSVLKTAGFAESTEITTMRDNLLNGDENTVGSIANKVKTAGFAKTDDVVTKTGFADQLEADLNKNDSTIKTALGNTFATKGTVESLSGAVNTLTGNENTEGSIAYKLKDFAKTNDVVTKTGFAEQLQNDLNAENSSVKSALATAGFAKTADVVTNTDFKNKLKTNLADSEVKSTLETAGFAKSDVVSALATRTTSLETNTANMLTSDNLATQLTQANSPVKSALKTAGFAESTEITTMRDNLLNGDENTVGSIANKVKTAGFAKTTDVVTNTDFKNKLKTNLADSEVKSTLETAGFAKSDALSALATRTNTLETKAITTDNLNTKMTNAGFAKSADVVSTSNFATQLQNSLTNNNVKSALADAGFAKSDVTDTVVTMSDLSKLLSGGLIVDSDGSVKLNSKSSKATSIENKIIEAKAKTNDNNIQTTGLKATTSITASIANVAASAAAASNEEIGEAKCNEMEYMFWDSYFEEGKGKCEKCPEGTYFNPEAIKNQNLPRCICEDKAMTFSYTNNEWKCTPSGDTDCLDKENTYWNGNACNECPPETYFNPESMKNSNLPRCICEDKTATFDASYGNCTAAGASACAGMGMIWSTQENKCIDCPDSAPFDDQTHTCVCKETEMTFSSQKLACIKCDIGQIEQDGECIEADETMCNQDSRYFWHIDENRCMSCPNYAPYDAILGRCVCKDEGWTFTPKTASCEECPSDTEYNSSTKTCTCKEPGQTFNVNDWACQ